MTEGDYTKTLEEYKLYLEMIEKTSDRRIKNNSFYLSVSSAVISLFALVITSDSLGEHRWLALVLLWVLVSLICWSWLVAIDSYKKLNSAKFEVILELEKELKHKCLACEWDILKNDKQYKTLSESEKRIPKIFMILSTLVIIGYSLFTLFS